MLIDEDQKTDDDVKNGTLTPPYVKQGVNNATPEQLKNTSWITEIKRNRVYRFPKQTRVFDGATIEPEFRD